MALEFLGGGSVEELLVSESGRIPVPVALDIALRVSEAMAYAHRKGVIHRDIKPGNILFVNRDDLRSVRLSDFGVAKAPERSPDLTVVGANVGTLWYMPPEQLNHGNVDARSDVYAIGATLYEMLTGSIPFEKVETSEVFRRFLDGAPLPPIRKRNPSVPPSVATLVELMLALEVDRRIPSARALVTLLRAAVHLEGLTVSSAEGVSSEEQLLNEELGQVLRMLPANLSSALQTAIGDTHSHSGPPTQSFDATDFAMDKISLALETRVTPGVRDTSEFLRSSVTEAAEFVDELDEFDDADQTIITVADIDLDD
jgi:serine/threonine protein kinase